MLRRSSKLVNIRDLPSSDYFISAAQRQSLALSDPETYRRLSRISRGRMKSIAIHRPSGSIVEVLPETPGQRMFRYLKMVLPHIGLVGLVVLYTLAGAGIFQRIEGPNEVTQRQRELEDLADEKKRLVSLLWNASTATPNMTWRTFQNKSLGAFQAYSLRLLEKLRNNVITVEYVQNKSAAAVAEIQWDFPGSIFFATTVVTTIGYGNITPQTVYGKVFCIFFGLFGIPLLLTTIADVGKFLAEFINFVYRGIGSVRTKLKEKLARLECCKHLADEDHRDEESKEKTSKRRRSEREASESSDEERSKFKELRIPVFVVIAMVLAYTSVGGVLFDNFEEGWSYIDAFYFRFGDFVPSSHKNMIPTIIYTVLGLAVTTMCIDLAGTEYVRKIHSLGKKMESAKGVVEDVGGGFVRIAGYGYKTGQALVTGIKHGPTAKGRRRRRKTIAGPEIGYVPSDGLVQRTLLLNNLLLQPLDRKVIRVLKPNIGVFPDEIHDRDAYVMENQTFGKPPK